MASDLKKQNHATGAVASLLAQESAFKEKQAPRVEIPGLAPRRTEKAPPTPAVTESKPKAPAKKDDDAPTKPKRSFRNTSPADDKFAVVEIPSEKIKPWKFANRPESEFGNWDEFVASIAHSGVEIPIIVRPDVSNNNHEYEVVAGRRRWRACLELGIPVPCNIRSLTDQEAAALQELENDERTDVSDWADALTYARLINEGVFKSQSALAVKLQVDRRRVSDLMAYTRIPKALADLIGPMTNVSRSHALVLASVSEEKVSEVIERIKPYRDKIRAGELSVRKLEKILSGQPDKPEPRLIKVNGVESHTIRKDSNGTAVISLRKELLEYISADEISDVIAKMHRDKLSG